MCHRKCFSTDFDLDQLVITPPVSATPTIYRSLPYPSAYGAEATGPYGYAPPYPIRGPAFAQGDYASRPLPHNPSLPTFPPATSQFYPPTSVAPYRTPLRRANSDVSFDTFAPQESSRHHHRHHHHDSRNGYLSEEEQYQSGEHVSSDRHRHRSQRKREKRERRRREREETEGYHGGYYAPEAGYDGRQ
jgi:hypothetical protein